MQITAVAPTDLSANFTSVGQYRLNRPTEVHRADRTQGGSGLRKLDRDRMNARLATRPVAPVGRHPPVAPTHFVGQSPVAPTDLSANFTSVGQYRLNRPTNMHQADRTHGCCGPAPSCRTESCRADTLIGPTHSRRPTYSCRPNPLLSATHTPLGPAHCGHFCRADPLLSANPSPTGRQSCIWPTEWARRADRTRQKLPRRGSKQGNTRSSKPGSTRGSKRDSTRGRKRAGTGAGRRVLSGRTIGCRPLRAPGPVPGRSI
ncbi:hypothetical protein J2Y69_000280 [Microbacterium resistens]|uniref:Uncharacterized protein n=1 Tax=Microbacterium resistens TaxID=156977 RepID=A0ABU1S8X1_9MICO|nr:hypothetical protein [Microbacterium resistens]